jgi:alpha-1,6-mannosyltransferase
LKICDVTQFYSPRSGGVKRYLHEKIAYLQAHAPDDEHLLIVPGAGNETHDRERSRVCAIASPLVSRTTQYRALLNLRAVEEIIEREQPDLIESADPYQLGWAAAAIARRRRIPAVAYYHSDFAEAYLRPATHRLAKRVEDRLMNAARVYTAALYNRFDATLVPSPELQAKLTAAGVQRVRVGELGVSTAVFTAEPDDRAATRAAHKISADRTLLLYVGRLANEKNTETLCAAFSLVAQRHAGAYHLLVIGDGQQRSAVTELAYVTGAVTWLPHCSDAAELAALYRAADLFVHPGVQETFGLVALESQACGTAVVGIRGSAMDRIILHDQDAWARENSAAALADAIERARASDVRRAGASAARIVAQRYDWAQVFDRLFCFYRELCAQYRRPAAE